MRLATAEPALIGGTEFEDIPRGFGECSEAFQFTGGEGDSQTPARNEDARRPAWGERRMGGAESEERKRVDAGGGFDGERGAAGKHRAHEVTQRRGGWSAGCAGDVIGPAFVNRDEAGSVGAEDTERPPCEPLFSNTAIRGGSDGAKATGGGKNWVAKAGAKHQRCHVGWEG